MCHGFQITYFITQQLSIVLVIKLLGHLNLEVNEKVSFQSSYSKFGILYLTSIEPHYLRIGDDIYNREYKQTTTIEFVL